MVKSLKNVAEVVASMANRYGDDVMEIMGGETTLYVRDGMILRVEGGTKNRGRMEWSRGPTREGLGGNEFGEGTSGQTAGRTSAGNGQGRLAHNLIQVDEEFTLSRGWTVDEWGFWSNSQVMRKMSWPSRTQHWTIVMRRKTTSGQMCALLDRTGLWLCGQSANSC